MVDIACVGILVADIMVKPVNGLPERGLLKKVDKIELHTGGNAMTAAINLSKMGISSSVIGKIGCDSLGDFLKNSLSKYEIDTKNVTRDEKTPTSSSVLMISEEGERTFFHCVGSNGTFRMSDVDWLSIENAKIVFLTGVFLLDDFDKYDLTDFLKRCKELNKITAVDVCWDSKNRWNDIIKSAMPYIDIFMPSIDEAKEIAKRTTPEECAEIFFNQGVKSVVIKLGHDGCYIQKNILTKGTVLPCCKNVIAVDTTGAGDSFCSGFLAAYSKGKSFCDCAKFANATGALCVMNTGATIGITSYAEIEEFLKNHS